MSKVVQKAQTVAEGMATIFQKLQVDVKGIKGKLKEYFLSQRTNRSKSRERLF
jgi:cell shape-determining protein MreC